MNLKLAWQDYPRPLRTSLKQGVPPKIILSKYFSTENAESSDTCGSTSRKYDWKRKKKHLHNFIPEFILWATTLIPYFPPKMCLLKWRKMGGYKRSSYIDNNVAKDEKSLQKSSRSSLFGWNNQMPRGISSLWSIFEVRYHTHTHTYIFICNCNK